LRLSLNAPSIHDRLTRALPSSDVRALDFALGDGDMRDMTTSEKMTRLLWDVCALPDYRKIAPAQHGELVKQIYLDIAEKGHIDEEYMAQQIRLCNNDHGEIDALSQRIAQIRTWTYVSNRPGWLANPQHWQEQTRAIENRLSDALHEKLTKRFVDRRTSVLMKRLRENTMLDATLDVDGRVILLMAWMRKPSKQRHKKHSQMSLNCALAVLLLPPMSKSRSALMAHSDGLVHRSRKSPMVIII